MKPLLSVFMITYNHEKYIAQAIESVINQKTNFDFKLIIGEDCSTDKTKDIILKCYQLYPEKIIPIFREQNVGMVKNAFETMNLCLENSSKYVAFCEGDDYWTDENKLQKQVDFLENNHDFSICFHSVTELIENTGEKKLSNNQKEITTINDLAKGNYIQTTSCVFRKSFDILPNWFLKAPPVVDYAIHLINAQYGKIKFINDNMAVYRIHDDSAWSTKSEFYRNENISNLLILMRNKFDSKVNQLIEKQLDEVSARVVPNTELYEFCNNNSEFVIFGAGSFGEGVKDLLYQKNKKVAYFVDNDIRKKGNKIDDIEIKHPSEIKQFEYKVIIASTWRKDIIKQLENDYNLKYFLDYI